MLSLCAINTQVLKIMSTPKKIVILGSAGNTGKPAALALLAKGHHVTVVGRSADSLTELTAKGATAAVGEIADTAFLTRILTGADAAYTMLPPNLAAPDYMAYTDKLGESVAAAVRASGIKYVVNLSSQGADLPSHTGPVVSGHRQEIRLNLVAGLNVMHLRPGYFLTNLFAFVPMVQYMNIIGSLAAGDVSFPMIAPADIGAVAAQHLDALDFSGRNTRDLLGAANYSFNEVAAQLSKLLGRNIPYVQLDREQQLQGMLQGGLSQNMADLYLEFYEHGFGKGYFTATPVRTSWNTTPTRLEAFLPIIAGAIQAPVQA